MNAKMKHRRRTKTQRSLFLSLPLSLARQISFYSYPIRLDTIPKLCRWLEVYPLNYVHITLNFLVPETAQEIKTLRELLNSQDCPTLNLSLVCNALTFNKSLLMVLTKSQRIEALCYENLQMDVAIGRDLLQGWEDSKNRAHLFQFSFIKQLDRQDLERRWELQAAQFVADLIARDQKIVYFCVNESGLDLRCDILVKCGLLDSLKGSRSLCYLLLRGVGLDAQGTVLLARALHGQKTMRLLDISANHVGDVGLLAIAECLKINTSLRFLILCSCNATEVSGCALAHALEANATVDLLSMRDDDLGAASGHAFAEMLKKNKTLHRLHLDYCDLKSSGCRAFVEALTKNSSLKHLTLNHSGIDFHDKAALIRVAKERQVLEILQVEDRNELTIPVGSVSRYTLSTDYTYLYNFETTYARHLGAMNRQRPQEPPANLN